MYSYLQLISILWFPKHILKKKKKSSFDGSLNNLPSGNTDTFYGLASFSFPGGNQPSLTRYIKFVNINHFELHWLLLRQEVQEGKEKPSSFLIFWMYVVVRQRNELHFHMEIQDYQ